MGTRGLIIYCYKRTRHAVHSFGACPSDLGVNLFRPIPKPSDGEGWQSRFEAWLAEERQVSHEVLIDATHGKSLEIADAGRICHGQTLHFDSHPSESFGDIEYTYETDLDNLCYLFCGIPYHALDNLPPIWLCFPQYPEADAEESEYLYVHKIIPYPSEGDPATLDKYFQTCTGTV
ncbi:hypothetical protein AAF712_008217 [Marasmius tenuissimus]|uniref:Uncharacterized protein n=1 Tax=Marasmius tenuissimus TaxID=585030 RepID=A0ABR2ZU70_9AGAR